MRGSQTRGSHAGLPDAGPQTPGSHAGPPDAGPPDAGPPDAGPPDAGLPDAGLPDAAPRRGAPRRGAPTRGPHARPPGAGSQRVLRSTPRPGISVPVLPLRPGLQFQNILSWMSEHTTGHVSDPREQAGLGVPPLRADRSRAGVRGGLRRGPGCREPLSTWRLAPIDLPLPPEGATPSIPEQGDGLRVWGRRRRRPGDRPPVPPRGTRLARPRAREEASLEGKPELERDSRRAQGLRGPAATLPLHRVFRTVDG
ncbi:proline-rich protein 2-like [Perognathus longimembris pacificus]|uniref:proline-rich protein 2-like n=1 Tax=Perognathus longimembris pacificus TaxID=214514 RepID=UPI0020185630|nr:proline-rich protein 2-like [Perognathus longimembris pacificus]